MTTQIESPLGRGQQPPEAGVEPNMALDAEPSEAAELAPTDRLDGSYKIHLVGDRQRETAPNQQPEATSQPPLPDPVTELLSGSDDELEAAIQQAQAEAEASAAELERWNQRQDELRQTRDRARQRIAELRPKPMELLAEALLRGNKRAQDRLSQLTRDLRELDSVVDDYEQVMMMAAGEGARLLARVAQHSAPVRHLQAKLKARQLVRQARAADEAAVAFLRELAAVRQSVGELVPLVPESARHYLAQFRAGDLPTRLSLAYHCRAMGQPAMPAVSELGPEPVARGPRQS